MEESWRGADHTQTSWGAADRCHESTAVIRTARMEGGEAEQREEGEARMERGGKRGQGERRSERRERGKRRLQKKGSGGKWESDGKVKMVGRREGEIGMNKKKEKL